MKESPIQEYMRTRSRPSIFLVVVVLGGGIKEELQRAFVLHRFDQDLGGIRLGLVLFSIMFGDAALRPGLGRGARHRAARAVLGRDLHQAAVGV